jgi:hypothetical protein
MTNDVTNDALETAIEAASMANALIRQQTAGTLTPKGDRDYASEVDYAVEREYEDVAAVVDALGPDDAVAYARELERIGFDYVPLPLDKVATAVSDRGMFYDTNAQSERLVFSDWGPKMVDGVPFVLTSGYAAGEDLTIRLLRNGVELGTLEVVLVPVPEGLRLDLARLSGPIHTLQASGGWYEDPDRGQFGEILGEVTSSDVALTLEALGYLPGIEARRGRLEAELRWQGPPGMGALASLDGWARLSMENGALREVRPGAGRVFGLLSLSALPRRFFLDFRDVFGRGLRFDRLGGDFVLVEGDAFTGNLELRGPAVTATVIGRTGLVTRDYDQRVIVDPAVGASLRVAGTLAGGVGVGAALLVVTELFRGPLARVGRQEFRLTGSWDAPQVQTPEEITNEGEPPDADEQ